MGNSCGGKKKPAKTETPVAATTTTKTAVLAEPQRQPVVGNPWEKPTSLPPPYPQGRVAIESLVRGEDFENPDLGVQNELVAMPLVGRLVPEKQIRGY